MEGASMDNMLVVGSVALDTVETPFGKVEEGLGGSATHFAASSSFFVKPQLVAVVGEDFPAQHIDFLKSRGICTQGLQQKSGKTFRWKGRYEYDLNTAHTLDTQLNVFESFFPELPSEYRGNEIVFLANIDPELQGKVIDQCDRARWIALDTMNFWIHGKREALRKTISRVNMAVVNEAEARDLSQERNLVKAARTLQSWGPRAIVIKRGEYGALLFFEDKIFAAPALPLEDIKDPTGAGDSFAGGLMGYLTKHWKSGSSQPDYEALKKACIYGSVMASFNVEDFSLDRLRNLRPEEIEARYREFHRLASFEQ